MNNTDVIIPFQQDHFQLLTNTESGKTQRHLLIVQYCYSLFLVHLFYTFITSNFLFSYQELSVVIISASSLY